MKSISYLLILLFVNVGAISASPYKQFIERYFSMLGVSPVTLDVEDNSQEVSYESVHAVIKEKSKGDYTLRTISYVDKSGITVEIEARIYNQIDAVEWVAHLKNNSKSNSSILSHINVCKGVLSFMEGEKKIYYSKGTNHQIDDFAPLENSLSQGKLVLGTDRGRSSDVDNLPFFNIASSSGGAVVGVGWTGSWRASVEQHTSNEVLLEVGFSDKMKFYLKSKEEVRTPSVVLMFWEGTDRMIGHNQFRQMVLRYFTPQINGGPLQCPITMPLGYNGPSPCVEFNCTNEWKCNSLIECSNQMGVKPDLWWIDAGWYNCTYNDWYGSVGTWLPDSKRFPNGMRPIGKTCHKYNQGFLIWFEPERVRKGSWLWDNKKEWLLLGNNAEQGMLDLSNEDAVKWISKTIIKYAKQDGLTWYRQDFNMSPLEYWEKNDVPNRIGISEIKHITGLYRFWDNLRAAGLFIDNCASGGRRIDLETIKRSIPLWRTDYDYCEPIGYQSQTYGLSFFLPCHTTGTHKDPIPYRYRSGMTNGGVTTWDLNQRGFDVEAAKILLKEHRDVRDFFYGDFYPLTPYNTTNHVWMGYQFHQANQDKGMVLLFRRDEAIEDSYIVKIQGLDSAVQYEVWIRDTDTRMIEAGDKLMRDGLKIQLKDRPSSALLTYQKIIQ